MSSEPDIHQLSKDFTLYMYKTVRALRELGYNPTRFNQMLIAENDGVAVVRRLVMADASDGLWRLKQLGRLDLSVEMSVLHPEYEELFDQPTRDRAYSKLRDMDFNVDEQLRVMDLGE